MRPTPTHLTGSPAPAPAGLARPPGDPTLTVPFAPAEPGSGGKTLAFEKRIRFVPARVVLITHDDGRLTAR